MGSDRASPDQALRLRVAESYDLRRMIRALKSDDFPPFGRFQMDFPVVDKKPGDLAEVHLLTGVNGTGKTRVLTALAAFLGHPEPLQRRLAGLERACQLLMSDRVQDPTRVWDDSLWFQLGASRSGSGNPELALSHRTLGLSKLPAFAYSGSAYVRDASLTLLTHLAPPPAASRLAFARAEEAGSDLVQAILNLKVQAALETMNKASGGAHSEPRAGRIVQAMEATVCEITKRNFAFEIQLYPKPTLVVRWGDALLGFDALPDGLRSIIGWLVHAVVMMDVHLQGKMNPTEAEAVFLLDEVESHLHPAWQRRILPAFQRLFPKSQIFVATHSPFVIASVNHGWIHPLTLGSGGEVRVEKSIAASAGDSYISVLEDVMGLKEWYDPETEELLAEFRKTRDAALGGDPASVPLARQLAGRIAERSSELGFVMGRELGQMERRLARAA
jgi:energy-coupling factor transporter ATP-binding protein EcfA2